MVTNLQITIISLHPPLPSPPPPLWSPVRRHFQICIDPHFQIITIFSLLPPLPSPPPPLWAPVRLHFQILINPHFQIITIFSLPFGTGVVVYPAFTCAVVLTKSSEI